MIKKTIRWTAWIIFFILLGLTISTFIYKERIINQVVRELNEYVNTPIAVNKIDFNFWEDFPNTSVTFYDVNIKGSLPDAIEPLVKANKIIINLNPFDLIQKNYVVKSIVLSEARVFIHIKPNGMNNYSIVKNVDQADSSSDKLNFSLDKVSLLNSYFRVLDETQKLNQEYRTEKNIISINKTAENYNLFSKGDVFIEEITLSEQPIVKNTATSIAAKLQIIPNDQIKINDSELKIGNSLLACSGKVGLGETRSIELSVSSSNSDLENLSGLVPVSDKSIMDEYSYSGNANFELLISGEISRYKSPRLSASFEINNGSILYKKENIELTNLSASGKFLLPQLKNISTGEILLDNLVANMNGYPIESYFRVRNLKDPGVTGSFTGTLDLKYLQPFIKSDNIISLEGKLAGNFQIDGKLEQIKKGNNIKSEGKFEVEDVKVELTSLNYPIELNEGEIEFSNRFLDVKKCDLTFNRNNIQLNGKLNNLSGLLFDKAGYNFIADISSNEMHVEDLIKGIQKEGNGKAGYKISPAFNVSLNLETENLYYKRFHGREISAKIDLKNMKAIFRELQFSTMGGYVDLFGLINTEDQLEINTRGRIRNLHMDSLFYVFNNFNQEWLKAENLEGEITADILTEMRFDENLKFISESLIADADASIKRGRLMNFEPMVALEKYIRDEDLEDLRFSDLQNNIHIEDRVIYIPEMTVSSNVTTINLSGTHTFDQKIDYKVVVPLKTLTGYDKDEIFGAVENDDTGSKLFLKITGNTKDYRIQYDTRAVKQKIITDLKDEVQELKDAFKKKEEEEVEAIELNEDEYFEWDTLGIRNIEY